jgi:acyl-CoA thioesterase
MEKRRFTESPFWQMMKINIRSTGPGQAELSMPIEEKHIQLAGVVHGGAIASLIDSAVAVAVWELDTPKTGITTIELKVNYLAPVLPGDELVAKAEIIHSGKKIVVGTVETRNQKGKMIAYGIATYMVFNNS